MSTLATGASAGLYHLITPANRMPSRLPWFGPEVVSTLLVTPRGRRCSFSEALLTASSPARSRPVAAGREHVIFVLGGELVAGEEALSGAGAYAYLGPERSFTVQAAAGATFLWIMRRWVPAELDGEAPRPPASFSSHQGELAHSVFAPGASRQELLPDSVSFDMAISVLSFEPGCGLEMTEIHDEDHGLYLLRGTGDYLLDGDTFPVAPGDFIFMAPYCPQHFANTGADVAEYLLYKPANRMP